MPSPTGIFINLTQAQRDALQTAAIDRITSGERTSLSGGGKSGSRQWQMSPQDTLFEINYANMIVNGPARAQKVVQALNPQYRPTTQFPVSIP